jgi:hypothetical protein
MAVTHSRAGGGPSRLSSPHRCNCVAHLRVGEGQWEGRTGAVGEAEGGITPANCSNSRPALGHGVHSTPYIRLDVKVMLDPSIGNENGGYGLVQSGIRRRVNCPLKGSWLISR